MLYLNALLLELRATCPKYFSLIARHMLVSAGDAHVEAALDAVTVLMYLSSLSLDTDGGLRSQSPPEQ